MQLLSFLFLSLLSLFTALEANGTNVTAGCMKKEREALVRFKQGLEDPSGRLSSWIGEEC